MLLKPWLGIASAASAAVGGLPKISANDSFYSAAITTNRRHSILINYAVNTQDDQPSKTVTNLGGVSF